MCFKKNISGPKGRESIARGMLNCHLMQEGCGFIR